MSPRDVGPGDRFPPIRFGDDDQDDGGIDWPYGLIPHFDADFPLRGLSSSDEELISSDEEDGDVPVVPEVSCVTYYNSKIQYLQVF